LNLLYLKPIINNDTYTKIFYARSPLATGLLAGKPLIAWTSEAANKSKYIDQCVISTDDEEIASISKENGGVVPFLRPKELALDETTTTAVFMHALNSRKQKYDLILLLQPTSPLRSTADIDDSLECFMD